MEEEKKTLDPKESYGCGCLLGIIFGFLLCKFFFK